MFLNKLNLINFKNLAAVEIDFSKKINCFTGNNGMGKTNILDAIYYLSFCKSYFNSIDSQNIQHDTPFFMIQGKYKKEDSSDDIISCSLKRGQRKQFKINSKEYDRLADHIGKFPLVFISPADTNLIYSGSEDRRKYFDGVISQFDKSYLDNLIGYNKVLSQRNALLKQFAEKHTVDMASLEIWNEQLIVLGNNIYKTRKEFLEQFEPIFNSYYKKICEDKEEVKIIYNSQINELPLKELLKKSVEKDLFLKYTTTGTHKDDFIFTINNFPVKKYGSQGQQKTFLVAMKLGQFEYTKNIKGYKPIMLFDDILDKLDPPRVKQLMKLVSLNNFGQIFITDTQKERMDKLFKEINIPFKIFEVTEGMIY